MDISRLPANNSISQVSAPKNVGERISKTIEGNSDSQEVQKEVEINRKKLESSVDFSNKLLFKNNTHLKFEIHEQTNDVMVKIIDDETGEVVREIPPEKMLDMAAKLWEIAGIIIDEKR